MKPAAQTAGNNGVACERVLIPTRGRVAPPPPSHTNMPLTARFKREVLVVTATETHTLADFREVTLGAFDAPGAPAARGLVVDIRKSKSAPGRSKLPIKAGVAFLDSIRHRYASRYSLVVAATTALQTVRLTALGLETLGIRVHLAPSVEEAVDWCRDEDAGAPGEGASTAAR